MENETYEAIDATVDTDENTPAYQPAESTEVAGEPENTHEISAAPDLHAHLMGLISQAEELKKEHPDFDLAAALTDAEFVRLTSPLSGVSVKRAYAAIHADEIAADAARLSAEKLSASITSGARRPREGGTGTAAAVTCTDPRRMSREQRSELKRRIRDAAARGEKIYPV